MSWSTQIQREQLLAHWRISPIAKALISGKRIAGHHLQEAEFALSQLQLGRLTYPLLREATTAQAWLA